MLRVEPVCYAVRGYWKRLLTGWSLVRIRPGEPTIHPAIGRGVQRAFLGEVRDRYCLSHLPGLPRWVILHVLPDSEPPQAAAQPPALRLIPSIRIRRVAWTQNSRRWPRLCRAAGCGGVRKVRGSG